MEWSLAVMGDFLWLLHSGDSIWTFLEWNVSRSSQDIHLDITSLWYSETSTCECIFCLDTQTFICISELTFVCFYICMDSIIHEKEHKEICGHPCSRQNKLYISWSLETLGVNLRGNTVTLSAGAQGHPAAAPGADAVLAVVGFQNSLFFCYSI